jgi:hypothetical protein
MSNLAEKAVQPGALAKKRLGEEDKDKDREVNA